MFCCHRLYLDKIFVSNNLVSGSVCTSKQSSKQSPEQSPKSKGQVADHEFCIVDRIHKLTTVQDGDFILDTSVPSFPRYFFCSYLPCCSNVLLSMLQCLQDWHEKFNMPACLRQPVCESWNQDQSESILSENS